MNAVEIEEAVSDLAGQPFDPGEFPYAFLTAFGNKDTTIKRLRTGNTNGSDVAGGVLQRNHIHIAVCPDGMVSKTILGLRESPKTAAAKAKFVLATDGISLEAEDLNSGEAIACVYSDFAKHFGFFLPLAGISTVKEIKNNPFDIKATGRLNKLYVELLKDNPEWATEARRADLNHFMARLIFCFFAEDTGIFRSKQFTKTIEQMSDSQSGNTHEILCELFRAMDLKSEDRETAKIKSWAHSFPYVNGGMFAGGAECPKFSRIARSYLLAVGNLEWDKINPDIFGSMIQAVAEDSERGELGMHYTSVPNILKVLNPLFLDDLRQQLANADDNQRKLRNLRKRMSMIRVFDPACGSGNFLVIAYKEMRAIEHEIVRRSGDDPKSWIKLDNFFGIELKNFAVEIARLALLIAEFQSDVQYLSQQEARAMVLPLHRSGQIRTGNALRFDWLEVCPPMRGSVVVEEDLGGPTGRLKLEDDGLTDGGTVETYICGNPPYVGFTWQSDAQKSDLQFLFSSRTKIWKSLDYVAGWFIKASDYGRLVPSTAAFVSTNSICQGQQVPILWPIIFQNSQVIVFAHTSFKWSNLASHNAGVTVVIVGLSNVARRARVLYSEVNENDAVAREVANINAYLAPTRDIIVEPISKTPPDRGNMIWGNKPTDGGFLLLDSNERRELLNESPQVASLVRPFLGAQELINGDQRFCLWIGDEDVELARTSQNIIRRLEGVRKARAESKAAETRPAAKFPHRFRQIQATAKGSTIVVGRVSSEQREYLPADLVNARAIIGDRNFALYDAPLWNFAILVSRLHWVWIGAVCVRLEMRFSYSNTMGWNTFPLPKLTDANKTELERVAKNILISREACYPASIADLYDPANMPDDLRRAHNQNDEFIERIFIGRKFRNDTERLEKLFELYSSASAEKEKPKKKVKRAS